ncbi:hypothetical protein CANCADRAFT_70908 [Tortispora caseinolytica NRRL Y-17796]|uniref:holo-[acyl-carrier-protein] synthase n=1 Tax=Tortispora caseinolytica NRRL Y-17796 TaxID=767744 RepID=A0A1E4TID8_9ASCO|nr:hypothetical protein CANCADRAFT_70908 [Tortispora caseinolytica NRRL Y-17796]
MVHFDIPEAHVYILAVSEQTEHFAKNALDAEQMKEFERYVSLPARYMAIGSFFLKKFMLENIGARYEEITYNEWNRPCIDNIDFNVSHDSGIVVGTVSTVAKCSIGIDTMKIGRLHYWSGNWLEEYEIVLTDEEQRQIRAAGNASAQYEAFFTIWTLKEAYSKALGQGMSINFKSVRCSLDPLKISITDKDLPLPRTIEVQHHKDHVISIVSLTEVAPVIHDPMTIEDLITTTTWQDE